MVKELVMSGGNGTGRAVGAGSAGFGVATSLLADMLAALDLPPAALDRVRFETPGGLPSAFAVTDLAAAAIGAASIAISELVGRVGAPPAVVVDRRLSFLWFGWSIRPIGWAMPAAWDAIAGDYQVLDGWIRLHTNAPRHREAALRVLDCHSDRSSVARAVGAWSADALERSIVEAGGCAAAMRSRAEWADHPQGRAVGAEPLIALFRDGAALQPAQGQGGWRWRPAADRPLGGLRVLDLTRILAGPVATRLLAAYGADVLRIDPPGWEEAGVAPEVTLGKRCARLDLDRNGDRAVFEQLLADADLLVHGYRPGALEALGYGETARRRINPSLVDVCLDAYGWSGPWQKRRGFDSLVQMSAGIAEAGMRWAGAGQPVPLPVQALDQATGYLMAAAAIRLVIARLDGERPVGACLSLARTAALLAPVGSGTVGTGWAPATEADYGIVEEATEWGPARRMRAPAIVAGAPMRWERPASGLGSTAATWRA